MTTEVAGSHFVDADAHIDECVETWSYIPESKSDVRPAEMIFAEGQVPRFLSKEKGREGRDAVGLFIDGQLFRRRIRSDEQTLTTSDSRELRDIPARLGHMDELGIEFQILFPSILTAEVTERPEIEVILCESYNRWMADRCSESNGRLRWLAVLPVLSMSDALKEMKRAKEAGAVGIAKRGVESGGRRAGELYFHPLYEMAQDLDMPVCFHVSSPYAGWDNLLALTKQLPKAAFYIQDAFVSLLESRTVVKFPQLRFLFVEAASAWVPWALYACNFQNIHRERSGSAAIDRDPNAVAAQYEEFLRNSQLFITCEANENLPLIIDQIGDGNLVVGTDYSHSDRSAILYGHRTIMERTDISQDTAIKLTDTNGRLAYGLPARN